MKRGRKVFMGARAAEAIPRFVCVFAGLLSCRLFLDGAGGETYPILVFRSRKVSRAPRLRILEDVGILFR